ncbi:hypothetical protein VII00023_17314 [Vibrio ichthyoenteri ATCC 700023]|uniref:Uncharacterized protein n=1 Tax=Vibrio ichthyoenteri ATCC 700023 TaxID=870968 RepID=F9S676_9VIBR|nr:hypothetical protein [Vibrio ichthyoenteri]EGU33914.1 hypothetical protein VII00023_17314 [Vibrio ichthyoenteri ATCC 700023]
MDNPKYYVMALLASLVLLLGLLLLHKNSTTQVLTAQVLESTLTQSLDGQRRFLTLDIGAEEPVVIPAPTNVQCSPQETAKIERVTKSFGRQSYHFISCQ